MVKLKHKGSVNNGKLILENTSRFLEDAKRFEGKTVQITIDKYSSKRSLEQNAYYWGVVLKILSDELGYTSEQLNDVLLAKVYGTKTIKSKTLNLEVPAKRSKELTTKQMEEYLEEIRVFAITELNITIPLPNEITIDT